MERKITGGDNDKGTLTENVLIIDYKFLIVFASPNVNILTC